MLKKLLPLSLLVTSSFTALAQSPATPPSPASTPMVTAPDLSAGRRDTLMAMNSLFQRRRQGGGIWLAVAGGFTGAILRGASSGDGGSNAAGALVGVGVLGGIPAFIGISKFSRFSAVKEAEAERAYRSGQPLPRNIARSLKKKDF